ncbi:MAG: gamma-glutamyltransferase, partial [Atribacterota bacterium]|nr:gamma-glutamyltransferase [Atribacterota bacterium]
MKPFDSQYYPYPSQRRVVFAKNGMVATSQYLAAQAGLEILRAGGNAIDAAIATAACLTVVEPTSNGIGGDTFALIWNKNKLHGLNASGPAPKAISAELLKKEGYEKIPNFGVIPVTVPGIPAAWAELSRKFGILSLPQVLAPAITYADKGFPVSSLISQLWQKAYQLYLNHIKDEALHTWFDTFAPEGKTPEPGELWRLPVQAKTLQKIADSDARAFYEGEIAEKIDTFFKKHNGYLSKDDLASFVPQWVNPISICYRGYDVWEIPPNGQGLVALMALNILKEFQITKIEEYD